MKIYVACPMSTYNTDYYDFYMELISDFYPTAELQEVPGLYQDASHFRATFKTHISTSDELVFFTASDGTIGYGVHDEIEYARSLGKSVTWIDSDDDDELCDHFSLQLIDGGKSWIRYATPVCEGHRDRDDYDEDNYDAVSGDGDDSGYGPGSYFEHAMNSDD